MTNQTYPTNFSHVGLSVPDIDAAVKFYSEVMGWYVIMAPATVTEDSSAIGEMSQAVFGHGWEQYRIAHLTTGDGVGIEMFEFKKNVDPEDNFRYFETGIFHYGVQDPNIQELVDRILAHGGKQRMPIKTYYPGKKPYQMVYMEDPFGNLVEIYTHAYDLTYSQGSY
ncbi:lactoylglutathione lyase family protein [Levilactobacillus bambusae]|uniref:Lactoylglutathione lyase family protein n=1 Tax=Levilactobacillus bambusae TaxID=2024736 RepID=A0A2V1N0Z1_9LACO|nr:lactoylglutathione lyase family protein [Levilactobacillus bambusae]PWG00055.1 lactoylglutathione lyase family protein [Levilactobacillus bambusae]